MRVGLIGRRRLNCRPIRFFALLGSLFALPTGLAAQDHQHEQASPAPTNTAWTWTTDANVIVGYNYQQRHFADFWEWESQNWMILSGEGAAGPGRLTVVGMLSFEPWTIGGSSPQTFQTGVCARRSSTISIRTIS
jgi:hypothetical protein